MPSVPPRTKNNHSSSAVGHHLWLRNLMSYVVDVVCVTAFLFLVLTGSLGRDPESCSLDHFTSVSSVCSPLRVCSSAGDVSNFPQQPFMSSRRLSQGSGIAQTVGCPAEIRLLFCCHYAFHTDRQETWTEAQAGPEGSGHWCPQAPTNHWQCF